VFVLDTDAEELGIPASALIDREFGARQDAFRRRVQDSGLTTQAFASPAARLAAVGGPDALAVRSGLARHPDQAHLAIRSAVLAAAARRDEQPPQFRRQRCAAGAGRRPVRANLHPEP